MEKVKVLIVGSDANAYYLARCAHETLNKKAHIISKTPWFFTDYSKIFTIEYHDDLWDQDKFVQYINAYADKFKDYKILLVAANDTYVEYLSMNAKRLNDNLYFVAHDKDKLASFQDKERFYKTYADSGLDFPDTKYFDIKADNVLPEMEYPIVVKPANVIMYSHLSFKGKKKIFRLENKQELQDCVELIKSSGYDDKLVIQEYIAGDDSYMFDCVVYVDGNNKVSLQTFAQVGLQDQSAGAVGNITLMINGFCTFKEAPVQETKEKIRKFFENTQYRGFADADIKYDAKTNKFKILEINARQGRGSYYVCACGYNLIKVMIDDLIFGKSFDYVDLNKQQLLTYVPKSIAKKYIQNVGFKKKVMELWKNRANPLEYKPDNRLKRILVIKKRQIAYRKTYKNAYWKADF